MPTENSDPFDVPDKRPAVSWKGVKDKTAFSFTVVDLPTQVQSRDFDTGEPATWPDGNPKYSVVIGVEIDGEEKSIWAAKPSNLFAAIKDAKDAAGKPIEIGGTLKILFVKRETIEKGKERNVFRAKYEPPTTPPPDAFGDSSDESSDEEEIPF